MVRRKWVKALVTSEQKWVEVKVLQVLDTTQRFERLALVSDHNQACHLKEQGEKV